MRRAPGACVRRAQPAGAREADEGEAEARVHDGARPVEDAAEEQPLVHERAEEVARLVAGEQQPDHAAVDPPREPRAHKRQDGRRRHRGGDAEDHPRGELPTVAARVDQVRREARDGGGDLREQRAAEAEEQEAIEIALVKKLQAEASLRPPPSPPVVSAAPVKKAKSDSLFSSPWFWIGVAVVAAAGTGVGIMVDQTSGPNVNYSSTGVSLEL